VNPSSGKGRDYFAIWEIDHSICPSFRGKITLNSERISKYERKIGDIKQLIGVGLAQVNILAGSICRVDIISENHNQLIRDFMARNTRNVAKENAPAKGSFTPLAKALLHPETMPDEPETEFIRKSLWDQPPFQGKYTLRELLKMNSQILWRLLCEELGQSLYQLSKESQSPNDHTLPRLLGETENYGLPPRTDEEQYNLPLNPDAFPKFRWIVTGHLRAETPFFFGRGEIKDRTIEEETEQTSKTILLNKDNFFRLPRSVIRGALRRDLRLVIGNGCNTPVGGKFCECDVCRIMRHVVVEDTISSCRKPPEIRYNIRLNGHTRTVEEGALFDTETGYQGMRFPFRLCFETRASEFDPDTSEPIPKFDPYLSEVMKHWKAGQAVFGGDTGAGFGRFRLEGDIRFFSMDVAKKEEYEPYLLARGFKGMSSQEILEKIGSGRTYDWNSVPKIALNIPPNKLPWKEICYTIEVISPLISRDPIRAMMDPRNTDTIMIRKRVFVPDGKGGTLPEPESRYFIKSETLRGILRSLVGGNKTADGEYLCDLDHEDCDCVQCRLFGSIHQQGCLRFEDAEVWNSVRDKKMDHVAIDRFTGGALDQMKFDDYPLLGCPEYPVILGGRFWIRDDISDKEKEIA